jgi:hypothetical protein
MYYFKRLLLTFFTIFAFAHCNSEAKIIFVDNTLPQDISNGTYSIKNRNNSGKDGNCYTTIQQAINAVEAGDTIYIRQGRYLEHIAVPRHKQGTEKNRILVQSYPGEWAVLDGAYMENRPVIMFKDGGHRSCPDYWTFRCFEVTGGGTKNGIDGGGGLRFDTAQHMIFEYLYIHDNNGGNGTNDGGIVIENDTQAAQNIIIRYCYLKNNIDAEGGNCANISLFSDYVDYPALVDIRNARQCNEVYYNYIVGSQKGIKNKAEQYLCLDNTGEDKERYKHLADKYHHNIIIDFKDQAITARQDFVQVYNNVVNSNMKESQGGISLGSSDYNSEREPFYACVYNNTFLGTGADGRIEHLDHSVYTPPLRAFVYFYNNIFENIGPEHNGRNDLNIYFSWNLYTEQDVDLGTVHVENNLFIPRTAHENIINLADNSSDFSATAWVNRGYSKIVYTSLEIAQLHLDDSFYKCNQVFALADGKTIANGGIGGNHPYLESVKLPEYIGAANPEDCAWLDGVQKDLSNVEWLKAQFAGNSPSWIEKNK